MAASRRTGAWDCGFPVPERAHAGHRRGLRPAGAARVRAVLPHRARTRRRRATLRPRYRETHEDRLWYWLYLPVARGVELAHRPGHRPAARPHLDLPACTASPPCSCCCFSSDDQRRCRTRRAIHRADARGAARAAADRLGQPVPRLAAEQERAAAAAALLRARQAVRQGSRARAQRVARCSASRRTSSSAAWRSPRPSCRRSAPTCR